MKELVLTLYRSPTTAKLDMYEQQQQKRKKRVLYLIFVAVNGFTNVSETTGSEYVNNFDNT